MLVCSFLFTFGIGYVRYVHIHCGGIEGGEQGRLDGDLKVVFGLEVLSLETDDDEISKLLETVRTPH